jgi:hypothetical protein
MKKFFRNCSQSFILGGALLLVSVVAHPASAQQPVVSAINGSVGAFGGWTRTANVRDLYSVNGGPYEPGFDCVPMVDNFCGVLGHKGTRIDGLTFGGEARLSVPLGQQFGLQLDGTAAFIDGKFGGTMRGHAFIGVSSMGTVGPMVQYSRMAGGAFVRTGLEGQLWLGPVSLYANGGYQFADQSRYIRVSSGGFACGEARVYVLDNAFVGVGGDWTSARAAATANGEFQLPGNMQALSFYAKGSIGEDDYRSAVAGVRWQLGKTAKLNASHRQDLLLSYGACGEEQFSTRRFFDAFHAAP